MDVVIEVKEGKVVDGFGEVLRSDIVRGRADLDASGPAYRAKRSALYCAHVGELMML